MKVFRLFIVVVMIFCVASACYAIEKRTARIVSIEGSCEVKRGGQASWTPASVGMVLSEGDAIKTPRKSWAMLSIDEGRVGTVEVKGDSQMMITELTATPETQTSATLLDLAIGEVLIKAKKVHGEGSKFEVKTPTSVVGVRGTTFSVKVEAVKE